MQFSIRFSYFLSSPRELKDIFTVIDTNRFAQVSANWTALHGDVTTWWHSRAFRNLQYFLPGSLNGTRMYVKDAPFFSNVLRTKLMDTFFTSLISPNGKTDKENCAFNAALIQNEPKNKLKKRLFLKSFHLHAKRHYLHLFWCLLKILEYHGGVVVQHAPLELWKTSHQTLHKVSVIAKK